jgi:putative phage-type endonuclease
MQVIECVQGTDEWFEARLGKVTASNFAKVLAKGQGKTRRAYMYKLAAERLTGFREDSFKNGIMEYGSETEPLARQYYEMANDCKVNEVGFVVRDEDTGASPDGFIGDDGIIEIKCPLSSTHIETIISDKMPTTHIPQVQGLLWVTERQWCDFISFDPKVLSRPMFCVRVERDKDYIINLAASVAVFVKELKEMTDKIQGEF